MRGALVLALIASAALAAQDRYIPRDNSISKTGTSVIRGRVVAAATGEALRKARGTKEPSLRDVEVVLTAQAAY